MAEQLARIFGTEEDRVNCPFYFKIGACRHGDRCSRQHHKPPFSQTILVKHMWQHPLSEIMSLGGDPSALDPKKIADDYDEFYEEIYEELASFGKVEECNVCENLGDHIVGNVYVKFEDEENADAALKALLGRFYAGRPLAVEFSPVTDFREARCRQYDEAQCARGGYCNFMHIKRPSRRLIKDLDRKFNKRRSRRSNSRERSRSRDRDKDREPRGDRDRSRDDRHRRSDRDEPPRDRRDDRRDDRAPRGDRERTEDRGDRGREVEQPETTEDPATVEDPAPPKTEHTADDLAADAPPTSDGDKHPDSVNDETNGDENGVDANHE